MKVKVETPRHTLVQYPNFRRIGREAEVLEPSVKVFKKRVSKLAARNRTKMIAVFKPIRPLESFCRSAQTC